MASLVWDCGQPRQTVGVNAAVSALVSIGDAIDSVIVANLDTTRVTDEGSTRTVMIVSAILVIAAFVLIGITVWFWRNTVPDPDALETLVFFEERVVDGAQEPFEQRRRNARDDARHVREGRHLPRPHRRSHSASSDRTETTKRSEGQRKRRQRED